jgi:drug/metabolite transporter (DMT)-like permease
MSDDGSGLLANPLMHFVFVLLGWGLSEYFMVISGKKLSVASSMFYNCVGLTLINLPNYYHVQPFSSAKAGCLMAAGTGIFYGIGDLCFFKLAHGPAVATKKTPDTFSSASVLAPICGLYVVIPVVLGIVVHAEPLTFYKTIALAMAIASIWLLSEEDDEDSEDERDDTESGRLLVGSGTDWADLGRRDAHAAP